MMDADMMHREVLRLGYPEKRDMHAFKMNGKRIDVGDLNSLNAIRKMNIDNA